MSVVHRVERLRSAAEATARRAFLFGAVANEAEILPMVDATQQLPDVIADVLTAASSAC